MSKLFAVLVQTVESYFVKESPRYQDGMLADTARVVEWQVHIGRDRLA